MAFSATLWFATDFFFLFFPCFFDFFPALFFFAWDFFFSYFSSDFFLLFSLTLFFSLAWTTSVPSLMSSSELVSIVKSPLDEDVFGEDDSGSGYIATGFFFNSCSFGVFSLSEEDWLSFAFFCFLADADSSKSGMSSSLDTSISNWGLSDGSWVFDFKDVSGKDDGAGCFSFSLSASASASSESLLFYYFLWDLVASTTSSSRSSSLFTSIERSPKPAYGFCFSDEASLPLPDEDAFWCRPCIPVESWTDEA